MATLLLYGDTIRYPAVRHEIPLEIMDPLLFVARDDAALVLTSSLESARIARALPQAELLMIDELGFFELLEQGMPRDQVELEVALRALRAWGMSRPSSPATCRSRSPTGCARKASRSTSIPRRWMLAGASSRRRSWQGSGAPSAPPRPAWPQARS